MTKKSYQIFSKWGGGNASLKVVVNKVSVCPCHCLEGKLFLSI